MFDFIEKSQPISIMSSFVSLLTTPIHPLDYTSPGTLKSLYAHFSVVIVLFFFAWVMGFLVSNFPLNMMFRKRSLSRLPSGLSRRRESRSSSGRTSSRGGEGSLEELWWLGEEPGGREGNCGVVEERYLCLPNFLRRRICSLAFSSSLLSSLLSSVVAMALE